LLRAAVLGGGHLEYHSSSHGQHGCQFRLPIWVASETVDIVPTGDVALALAMVADAVGVLAMGQAGRARVEKRFCLTAMVLAYQRLHDSLPAKHAPPLNPLTNS
jgi:hypothetical protein